jgi:glycosyltransferase involved in cell wall biosynthesis
MSVDRPGPAKTDRTPVSSIFSGQFELDEEFNFTQWPRTSQGSLYDKARLLVRLQGEPLGFVTLSRQDGPFDSAAVLKAIDSQLDPEIRRARGQQAMPPRRSSRASCAGRDQTPALRSSQGSSQAVTVVICTRGRARTLRPCLNALCLLEHDAIEFVVVDNAPPDDSTRELVGEMSASDPRFRYVREPHPGLSWARNRGLAHATGEIVAYTDDDVRVDSLWVRGLLRGFDRRPDVACVTGLVASASLELAAEQYFDARVWWSSSCKQQIYDARHGPKGKGLHPYAAGGFGTGANFAFRTQTLRDLGGFDESLGAGTRCSGGEDLDIFVRCLRAGAAISYEPAALVWHEHRSDQDDLSRQMHAYGRALSAYLFKYASSPRAAIDVWRRLPQGVRHLTSLGFRSRRAGSEAGLARELLLSELIGAVGGPLAYLRARSEQDSERRKIVGP